MKLPIPFPNPRTYVGHSGVDFGQKRGTPIPASGPGKVSHRGRSTRGGCYIWVHYDNGPLVGYHHMDNHGGCPPDGTRVREGTRLGYVGSLGKYSTGPHLHSEIAGHATTAGYWKYFDANRVVGASKPAGDDITPIEPEEDDDMKCVYMRDSKGRDHYAEIGEFTFRRTVPYISTLGRELWDFKGVTEEQWNQFEADVVGRCAIRDAQIATAVRAAIGTAAGGSVDLSPVLKAIEGIKPAVTAESVLQRLKTFWGTGK